MGRAGAQRGARANDVAPAIGNDPLHADDAVPGAAQGPAAAGAGAGAHAHPGARRPRWAHRCAAGERARREGGRAPDRAVARRRSRQRRRAGGGGEGAGGIAAVTTRMVSPSKEAEGGRTMPYRTLLATIALGLTVSVAPVMAQEEWARHEVATIRFIDRAANIVELTN